MAHYFGDRLCSTEAQGSSWPGWLRSVDIAQCRRREAHILPSWGWSPVRWSAGASRGAVAGTPRRATGWESNPTPNV